MQTVPLNIKNITIKKNLKWTIKIGHRMFQKDTVTWLWCLHHLTALPLTCRETTCGLFLLHISGTNCQKAATLSSYKFSLKTFPFAISSSLLCSSHCYFDSCFHIIRFFLNIHVVFCFIFELFWVSVFAVAYYTIFCSWNMQKKTPKKPTLSWVA